MPAPPAGGLRTSGFVFVSERLGCARFSFNPDYPMRDVIPHLNYVHILVVTIVGFMLGWLGYSMLFGKAWMVEMKITPEMMKESQAKGGMGAAMAKGFVLTLLSTFG